MRPFDIILLILLPLSLAFAAVELGLTAHGVYVATGTYWTYCDDGFSGFYPCEVNIKAPGILIFLLFASVWTFLTVGAGFLLSLLVGKNNPVGANKWLAPILITLYAINMIFWLGGFADVVSQLGGKVKSTDMVNAAVAFSILLWIVFTVLLILTVIGVCNGLKSTFVGYMSLRGRRSAGAKSMSEVRTTNTYGARQEHELTLQQP